MSVTPLILVAEARTRTSRSAASVVSAKGHVILKAYTGQQALDLVQKVSPDAVLIDADLPDLDTSELIRRLKASPTIHSMTPIVVITGSTMDRSARLGAFDAGAWDVLVDPVEPDEFFLRLNTFVRGKQEADRIRDEGLTDPFTGLYNVRGVLQRAKQISADAQRFDRPLTCVAFGAAESRDAPTTDDASEVIGFPIGDVLKSVTRVSDTIGRVGPREFVVIAPGTGLDGAVRLADRVLRRLDDEAKSHPAQGLISSVRAGLCTRARAGTSPEDLLLRATMALRKAQAGDASFRVRSYEA